MIEIQQQENHIRNLLQFDDVLPSQIEEEIDKLNKMKEGV